MKKLILAVSVVVLLLSCMDREHKAFKYYWDGKEAEYYGRRAKAIEYFTKAIQLAPDTTHYLCDRGEMYAKKGELALATADFDEVLRIQPDYRKALELRADTLEQSGDLDGALADFTELIRLRSVAAPSSYEHIRAYYNRAQFHVRHGESDKAIQDFTEMAQLSSAEPGSEQHMRAYYNIAQIHLGQGEFDQAIQDFTTVVQYQPKFLSAAYYWRAFAYMEMGAFDKAIADFTEALEYKPNDPDVAAYEFAEAYSQRGVAYFEMGNLDQAIADFTEAILLNPSLAVMSEEEKRGRNWSNDYLQQKLMVEQMRVQSLHIQPGSGYSRRMGATMNLANGLARKKAINDLNMTMAAIADVASFERALASAHREAIGVTLWPVPDFAAAHTRRGLVYFEKGDYGLAIADFEDALQIDGDNFVAWEQLETALSFDPDHPFASEIMSMAKSQ